MPRPRATTSNSDSGDDGPSLRAPSSVKGKARDAIGGPLQRGSACLNCRKRKLKCDAGKPACQQCIRAGTDSECSYDNGKALSKTQILQQRIAQLEAKLSTLQGRGGSTSTGGPAALGAGSSSSPGAGPSGSATPHSSTSANRKDSGASDILDPFGSNNSGLVGIRTASRSPSMGAFGSPSLYDNTFGSSVTGLGTGIAGGVGGLGGLGGGLGGLGFDYTNPAIAPSQLISPGIQPRMSPYLQSTVDLYDPNAPWPTGPSSSQSNPSADFQPSNPNSTPSIASSSSLFPTMHGSGSTATTSASSPGSGVGTFNTDPAQNVDQVAQIGGGTIQKATSAAAAGQDFRASLRNQTDPNCITATPEGRQYLLRLFLPQRQRYYFDVHLNRFLESIQHPDPRKRPHPCLMDAIYLLACYISRDDSVRQYESGLLSRARQGLCDSLEHSDRLWNFVQASSLIAFYLYQNGRFIEAYHQTCQVARFAVSCGLHQISSPLPPSENSANSGSAARTQAPWTVTNMSVRRAGSMLEAPKDGVEVGERILAFWHIFLLDRCGSIMTNLPAALPDECDSFSQIETVWPRTLEEYESGNVYESDYSTVRFLYQAESVNSTGRADTVFTLRLKASALFERASRLGSRYSANMSEQMFGLFRAVDFAISKFSQTLPYARNTGTMGEIPSPLGPNAPVNAQLVFVHTLALTATMRLHYLAAKDEPISYQKRLNAANATVVVANELMGNNVDYSEFDMLLGYCWKTASDVFIQERQGAVNEADIVATDQKIDTLLGHMQTLQTVFPLTVFQINEVVQSRAQALSTAAVLPRDASANAVY